MLVPLGDSASTNEAVINFIIDISLSVWEKSDIRFGCGKQNQGGAAPERSFGWLQVEALWLSSSTNCQK